MTVVAITGDGATTLTLALASSWPTDRTPTSGAGTLVGSPLVVEADPGGGSLAGWLDTPTHPTLATVATAVGRGEPAAETIRTMTHRTASGLRCVTAPVRRSAAHRSIAELPDGVVEELASTADVVLVDLGAVRPEMSVPALLRAAGALVLVHRQRDDTARAESVRLERLAEAALFTVASGVPVTLAVTGSTPFDPAEIADFVDGAVDGRLHRAHPLPEDRLAAAVLCGRTGVSARRLSRLPLMRAAATLAAALADDLDLLTGARHGLSSRNGPS